MATMYTRLLAPPDHSFFLFGPRATGKTTWLRQNFPTATTFNLLLDGDYLPLLGSPQRLRERVEALPDGSWVVIDEVQRLPKLLNEVHELISRHDKRYRYALSGSSARKLRQMDVNLLAGRVIERAMHPLVKRELEDSFDLEHALGFGTLPVIVGASTLRADLLDAYVNTYLRQEIQQEALVKDIGSFHRFLRVAAMMHGQVINVANTAREANVARKTVERYFDTLVDTLVAYRLPGWQPRAKVREHQKPKFYFMDPGVVRALRETHRDPIHDSERGALLEGYILHELRAARDYLNCGGTLSYWNTTGNKEIDFIWQRGEHTFGVEVKSSTHFRTGDAKNLNEFIENGVIQRGYVVYRGSEPLRSGNVSVLPVADFCWSLYDDVFVT